MPRETVLAGFTVPPPNAYGICQIATISTVATPYARLRNGTTGAIFLSRIHVKPRNRPSMRVEVIGTADNPVDTGGTEDWLDQRRAGNPSATVHFSSTSAFPAFTEIYGDWEVGKGGGWIELPATIAVGSGVWVQSYLTGTMDTTFFWFEP